MKETTVPESVVAQVFEVLFSLFDGPAAEPEAHSWFLTPSSTAGLSPTSPHFISLLFKANMSRHSCGRGSPRHCDLSQARSLPGYSAHSGVPAAGGVASLKQVSILLIISADRSALFSLPPSMVAADCVEVEALHSLSSDSPTPPPPPPTVQGGRSDLHTLQLESFCLN